MCGLLERVLLGVGFEASNKSTSFLVISVFLMVVSDCELSARPACYDDHRL